MEMINQRKSLNGSLAFHSSVAWAIFVPVWTHLCQALYSPWGFVFHRMPYATHSRVIEGFTCERLLPPSSVCVCVISTSSEHRLQTVHESLAGLYACVLLPLCSIHPTVMCWEALIEYTIWREPASHQFGLLETQPNHNALLSSNSQVTKRGTLLDHL